MSLILQRGTTILPRRILKPNPLGIARRLSIFPMNRNPSFGLRRIPIRSVLLRRQGGKPSILEDSTEFWSSQYGSSILSDRCLEGSFFKALSNVCSFPCSRGGCQARSKAQGSGPCPVGVRGFKSHPPHHFSRKRTVLKGLDCRAPGCGTIRPRAGGQV